MKILIPSHFSANAQLAADFAIMTFGLTEAEYVLLNLYHEPHAAATSMISLVDIAMQDSRNSLKEESERLIKTHGQNLQLRTISEYGEGGRKISLIASAEACDLIIMGTKGATGLKEVLVGSVASDTINASKVPVLMIPEDSAPNEFRSWLVAIDEMNSSELLKPVRSMATLFNAGLSFLKITKGVPGHTNGLDHRPSYLMSTESYTEYSAEDPVNGINDYIKKNKADLLVMFPGNHGFLDRLFKRSTTGKMAMHTNVPLLTVHK
jgi:nucleotide-binding universal stress UspA family protein